MIRVRPYPSVQLALNNQPVLLHNINIRLEMVREDKDMSGQRSTTAKSDKGLKAKQLTVSGLIPYQKADWLTALFKLAEAETDKGEQVKYRVVCVTSQAVNMREATFTGAVTADELHDKLAWAVSFKLREVNSIAEKKNNAPKSHK